MLTGVTLICFFRSKHWRDSGKYHASALYMMIGNFLYLTLTSGYLLWAFVPDLGIHSIYTEMCYALIVFPLTALMFLNGYPETVKAKVFHYVKWVTLYAAIEFVMQQTGRMAYGNGWGWYYSVAFDLILFPMLRLHSRKPLLAYAVSVPIIVVLLLWFRVPLDKVSANLFGTGF